MQQPEREVDEGEQPTTVIIDKFDVQEVEFAVMSFLGLVDWDKALSNFCWEGHFCLSY